MCTNRTASAELKEEWRCVGKYSAVTGIAPANMELGNQGSQDVAAGSKDN